MNEAVALLGAAVVLAGTLLLRIPAPWGGSVPAGLALVMALPALLEPGWYAGATGLGIVAALTVLVRREHAGRHTVLATGARWVLAAVVAGAAANLAAAGAGRDDVLVTSAVAAAAVVAGELGWMLVRAPGGPTRIRSAAPVHLTLACAAVLFAVAVEEVGVAMAAVAALPLAVTRFAFGRYAEATETLRQTMQALGLVPELAGLAPLGHSERAAMYAAAIADELGFDRPGIDRIVTATRLHHLGAVRADDRAVPTSPAELAERGSRILRESGFPGEIADLLADARADGFGTSPSLAAAVVRVATAFDHVVGIEATAADRGLAVLSSVSLDPHGRRAAAALLSLVATHPGLVVEAIAAGDRFRDAAAGLDLEALVGEQAGGALLPFAHRPGSEP